MGFFGSLLRKCIGMIGRLLLIVVLRKIEFS